MKSKLPILLFISLLTLNVQAKMRSFNFRDVGKVYYSALEREIAPGLDYAEVQVKNIRNSYNPIAFLSSLTSQYNSYVIDMVIDHTKNVSCELSEIKDEKKIMIKMCKGTREDINHIGFIFYKDLN